MCLRVCSISKKTLQKKKLNNQSRNKVTVKPPELTTVHRHFSLRVDSVMSHTSGPFQRDTPQAHRNCSLPRFPYAPVLVPLNQRSFRHQAAFTATHVTCARTASKTWRLVSETKKNLTHTPVKGKGFLSRQFFSASPLRTAAESTPKACTKLS